MTAEQIFIIVMGLMDNLKSDGSYEIDEVKANPYKTSFFVYLTMEMNRIAQIFQIDLIRTRITSMTDRVDFANPYVCTVVLPNLIASKLYNQDGDVERASYFSSYGEQALQEMKLEPCFIKNIFTELGVISYEDDLKKSNDIFKY